MLRLVIDWLRQTVYSLCRGASRFCVHRRGRPVNRLKGLVHYICEKCKDEPGFGATKLNKILWYLDTFTFLTSGKSFSGNTKYVRQKHGPVARQVVGVLRNLENEGSILIQKSPYYNRTKTDYVVLRPADDSKFTADEKNLIDEFSQTVCRHTAKEISNLTHDNVWEAAEEGEEIPLFAILAKPDNITQADRKWLRDVVMARHS
jgi:hypothetical protein